MLRKGYRKMRFSSDLLGPTVHLEDIFILRSVFRSVRREKRSQNLRTIFSHACAAFFKGQGQGGRNKVGICMCARADD